MKIKVEKDGVVKELDNTELVADYVSAGWKLVEETKKANFNSLNEKGNN